MNAGYSGTPLLKKLGAKTGSIFRAVNSPPEFTSWLNGQLAELTLASDHDKADVIVYFSVWEQDLVAKLPTLIEGLKTAGGLWIAWPKKASKAPTDITEDRLRDLILPIGLVDNKVCAIDDKWSGLRFVWRLEHRKKFPDQT